MVLTREKRKMLDAQYARWGIDAVRANHDRNAWLLPPDIVAFTSGWISAAERRQHRGSRHVQVLRALAIGLLAGALLARLMNRIAWPFA